MMSSGNDTRLARMMLEDGWIDNHQNLFNSLKEATKKQVICLFFGQPKL